MAALPCGLRFVKKLANGVACCKADTGLQRLIEEAGVEVKIIADGPIGSGKSALLGEIEIALKAIGVPVRWFNPEIERQEKNMTHADWAAEIERTKPSVVLIESRDYDPRWHG